jgi:beta-glucosidase-like glycosyl hydrolase/CubicO group peptidase (beta-lactamase class C family)
MKKINLLIAGLISFATYSQNNREHFAQQWVDSVFNSLSREERIAQLMVVRAHSNLGPEHVAKVTEDIQKYNIGALCFFQGGPLRQANLTNFYQSIAKTPLLVTIDGEWGLGMRLDSVTKFPYQLTLGALSDKRLVYEMGLAVGEQCRRLGVHVNYAPVVDINNSPKNPVIGYRSIGEDKYKVAQLGVAYMKGMQDAGIMACAKHFPGHGDVDVDSHLDLPVINKSKEQLDSLELVPFRELFKAGVGSVMIAHLYIPAIDTSANRATSLSKNNVTDLLRFGLGYQGLTFTDALEMKGVSKFFPSGDASVEALIAGNDMLCLPASVPEAIEKIKLAIDDGRLNADDIDARVKKVLRAKYQLGLSRLKPVDTNNLLNDLNAKTDAIRIRVARQTITVIKQAPKNDNAQLPIKSGKKFAYIGIGSTALNEFGKRMADDLKADTYLFSWKDGDQKAKSIFEAVDRKYEVVIIGIHDFNNRPADNYKISNASLALWRKLNKTGSITLVFGNVLAAANYCNANALVACYQDDNITQLAAADLITGKSGASGRLPVSVCNFSYGSGIDVASPKADAKRKRYIMEMAIDSIVGDAISQKAFPGCMLMAVKDGAILFNKAYGYTTFDNQEPVSVEKIFDLASVTKISATTVSVMKLYEQGKISLDKTLGDYLPWVRGTDKTDLVIEDILLHQAGLVPFIPFYRETIDTATGLPLPGFYSDSARQGYTIKVAGKVYLRNDWQDTIIKRILQSPLGKNGRYVYSDNDFIFLGKIVEQLSGLSLDAYVQKTFYSRMGLETTGFKPKERFAVSRIVPTEEEKHFRRQLLWGDVHDEGASLFGGVAGHAGLFSDAYDLAMLYQMLLNGGTLNGEKFLKPETIKKFTAYGAKDSRRGLGFDKPEKDNELRKDPYPALLASPETFGHTGFTGTCVWVDPKYNLVFIFLSNRVNPTRNNPLLGQLRVREKILDAVMETVK